MRRVLCTPHDPGGSSSKSTSESKHLDTGVALESRGGNDSVLDGVCGSRTNRDSTKHLEDGTEDHSLSVGDGPGGDGGGPRVGDII